MSRFFSFFLLILRIEVGTSALFPKKKILPYREITTYPSSVNARHLKKNLT